MNFARFTPEKMLPLIFVDYWNPTLEQADNGVLIGLQLFVALQQHLDSRDDQKSSKDVDHPMEVLEQGCPSGNKNGSHDQRTDNPPKKNSVLIDGGGREILKNHEKDEQIIDTKGFFDNVAGEKFESFLLSPKKIDP